MKKDIVDYLSSIALGMILTFQMWHTSSLYLTYSRLSDEKATFAAYFLAFTIEFMVFIFVWKGIKAAGAVFAVCLFFVGILFNDNWTGSVVQVDPLRLYLPKNFVSSTLLQFMSSLSIWYLTEIHVENRNKQAGYREKQELNKVLSEMIRQKEHLQSTLNELENKIRNRQDNVYDLDIIKTDLEQTINTFEDRVTELEQERRKIEQEINSLKKSKAGASKRSIQPT